MSKMTDEQIKKALEVCSMTNMTLECKNCPYNTFNVRYCSIKLCEDALDLINRQQHQLDNYSHNVRNMAKDFIDQQKIIQEQRAEIERLSSENAMLQLQKNIFDQKIQSEAIKEYLDKLKSHWRFKGGVVPWNEIHEIIGETYKEMVGK